MITTVFTFLKSIPAWGWIALVSVAIVYGIFESGRTVQRNADQAKYDYAIAHADTIFVDTSIDLPQPNVPKPIKGKVLPLTSAEAQELQELRERKITDSLKLMQYDSALTYVASPFVAEYEDKVDSISATADPMDRSIMFSIVRKKQTVKVPHAIITLPALAIPWYESPIARVVYGVIGSGCIYEATQSSGKSREYFIVGGTVVLVLGVSL